jgi:hypothetical protein
MHSRIACNEIEIYRPMAGYDDERLPAVAGLQTGSDFQKTILCTGS